MRGNAQRMHLAVDERAAKIGTMNASLASATVGMHHVAAHHR